ncbi:MAG: hypothetical protein NZT61_03425 [Deltaproteobacteria bacterium]|nr:hypothetical protein [Deltaproteobacteria bacterium]
MALFFFIFNLFCDVVLIEDVFKVQLPDIPLRLFAPKNVIAKLNGRELSLTRTGEKGAFGRVVIIGSNWAKEIPFLVLDKASLKVEKNLISFGIFNRLVKEQVVKARALGDIKVWHSENIEARVEKTGKNSFALYVYPKVNKLIDGEVLREEIIITNTGNKAKIDVVGIFVS